MGNLNQLSKDEKRAIEARDLEEAKKAMEKIMELKNSGKIPNFELGSFDHAFMKKVFEIIEHGNISLSDIRPVNADGTSAFYMSVVGIKDKYDLSKTFPVTYLRDISKTFKNMIDEFWWTYVAHSNNVNELHSHIWDQWADETGSIGKAYGGVVAELVPVKIAKDKFEYMNRIDAARYILKHDPESRSNILQLFDSQNANKTPLMSCIASIQLCGKSVCNFTDVGKILSENLEIKNTGKRRLDVTVYQRSQDMLTANCWDVIVCTLLAKCLAIENGYECGTLTHMISDCHIYIRHFPQLLKMIQESIKNEEITKYNADVKIDENLKDPFNQTYEQLLESIKLVNYPTGLSKIGKVEVAI